MGAVLESAIGQYVPTLLQARLPFHLWEGEEGSHGFVANFAQKVMKGQLPLSVRRLRGEGVELFGRSEALVPSLNHHLFFPDHVHEFDPN